MIKEDPARAGASRTPGEFLKVRRGEKKEGETDRHCNPGKT